MNILHTADWHFGKQLYKYSLQEEMQLFLVWLEDQIKDKEIDMLLISGDIFDVMNPSNADKERYFNFLKMIRSLDIVTVITGGNHDSVNFLNSSKAYLRQDKIYVVGGATKTIEDEVFFFSIKGEDVVICAVPFLRDKDLRSQKNDIEFNSRYEAIQYGLQVHYQNLLVLVKGKYPKTPVIAMGHLFAVGASTSDSEREIHIGNTGQVSHTIFDGYDYVALGHIHKPQRINNNEMIRYSGSPVSLSFSERKDIKQVLMLRLNKGCLASPEVIEVPKFRSLIRFKGAFELVKQKISIRDFRDSELPAYVEFEIVEEQYSIETIQQVNDYVSFYNDNNDEKIIFNSIRFKEGSKKLDVYFDEGTSINDLSEKEVFSKIVLAFMPNADEVQGNELKETFDELLEMYRGQDED